jgi:hypothetical protein
LKFLETQYGYLCCPSLFIGDNFMILQEFTPTTLYIKTHNKTGLKYFGKTIKIDVHKYKGSGTLWKHHIKKHGYDVTTEIVGLFTDKTWIMFYALEFSEANNIVTSKEWANLKSEDGCEGGAASGENSPHYGKKHTADRRENTSIAMIGMKQSEDHKRNRGDSKREKILIRCMETGEVFNGPSYAADWLKSGGILTATAGNITHCCRGIYKAAYGYHWEYIKSA